MCILEIHMRLGGCGATATFLLVHGRMEKLFKRCLHFAAAVVLEYVRGRGSLFHRRRRPKCMLPESVLALQVKLHFMKQRQHSMGLDKAVTCTVGCSERAPRLLWRRPCMRQLASVLQWLWVCKEARALCLCAARPEVHRR